MGIQSSWANEVVSNNIQKKLYLFHYEVIILKRSNAIVNKARIMPTAPRTLMSVWNNFYGQKSLKSLKKIIRSASLNNTIYLRKHFL